MIKTPTRTQRFSTPPPLREPGTREKSTISTWDLQNNYIFVLVHV